MKRLMPTPMSTMPVGCPAGVAGMPGHELLVHPEGLVVAGERERPRDGLAGPAARGSQSWVVQMVSLTMDSRAMESPRS